MMTKPQPSRHANGGGLFAPLAEFAASTGIDSVPPIVRDQAALCIADTIGCIIAGTEAPEWRDLLAAEQTTSGNAAASVFGAGRMSVDAAARLNAYAGDIFELNDLIGGHASIASVPTALAVGEALERSGADILRATALGIEISTRIHSAYYAHIKPYTETGMSPTAISSTAGAAVAAGLLMGLNEVQLAEAMAIAGTLASWSPTETLFGDGGTAKPLIFGALPASNGILAARYAQAGLTGPVHLLDSPMGYYATVARGHDRMAVVSPGKWHLENPRRKLHACCGYIHSAIDLMAELAERHGTAYLDGARLHVKMPPYIVPAVSKSTPPCTPTEARFHAQYAMAVAYFDGGVIRPEHSMNFDAYASRPDIAGLMRSITIEQEPAFGHYQECSIDIEGKIHLKGTTHRGAPEKPLDRQAVEDKFISLVARVMDANTSRVYLQRLASLADQRQCAWIFTPFVGTE